MENFSNIKKLTRGFDISQELELGLVFFFGRVIVVVKNVEDGLWVLLLLGLGDVGLGQKSCPRLRHTLKQIINRN